MMADVNTILPECLHITTKDGMIVGNVDKLSLNLNKWQAGVSMTFAAEAVMTKEGAAMLGRRFTEAGR